MSATDLAALILAAVAIAAVVVLSVVCVRLAGLVRSLRAAVDDVVATLPPASAELTEAAARAAGQVDRLEALIRTTASITETVDTATQATFRVLANPLIKGAALASGTGSVARRLRGRPTGSTPDEEGR